MRPPYSFFTDDELLDRFNALFGSEERTLATFRRILWPHGFRCRKCGGDRFTRMKRKGLEECKACRHQQSLTAGTPLSGLRAPLHVLAAALFLHLHPQFTCVRDYLRRVKLSESQSYRWRVRFEDDLEMKSLMKSFRLQLYSRRLSE